MIGSSKKRIREEDVPDQLEEVVVYKPRNNYRNNYKNNYKKNNYKKTRTTSYVMRGPNITPDSYSVKMNYTWTGNLISTSGAGIHQKFRGNSLFDPDQTGSGNQPSGFDELMGLYNFFRVMGSSIDVTVTSANTTIADDFVLHPQNGSTIIGTTTDAWSEQPYAQRRIGFSYNEKFHLKKYMSTPKMYGVSKTQVRNEDDYHGSSAGNPANEWYWILSYASIDRSTTQGVYVVVKVSYYATFYNRKPLNIS